MGVGLKVTNFWWWLPLSGDQHLSRSHQGIYPESRDIQNKRHSYHPGNSKGFWNSVSTTRNRNKHIFLLIYQLLCFILCQAFYIISLNSHSCPNMFGKIIVPTILRMKLRAEKKSQPPTGSVGSWPDPGCWAVVSTLSRGPGVGPQHHYATVTQREGKRPLRSASGHRHKQDHCETTHTTELCPPLSAWECCFFTR